MRNIILLKYTNIKIAFLIYRISPEYSKLAGRSHGISMPLFIPLEKKKTTLFLVNRKCSDIFVHDYER